MTAPQTIDPLAVKRRSESAVLAAGGRICDWLPIIETTKARDVGAVIDRALVLNALVQLYFRAPSPVIAGWINRESLRNALSVKETALLAKPTASLTEQERIALYWYIEALWAILWATQLIKEMPFDRGVEDFMGSLCPNLQRNEDGTKFRRNMRLRSYPELSAGRDQARAALPRRCSGWGVASSSVIQAGASRHDRRISLGQGRGSAACRGLRARCGCPATAHKPDLGNPRNGHS